MDPILGTLVDVGDSGVVIDDAPSGLPIIALPSALTGLHYFDGQAMRDASLTAEQRYRRALAALAARAGGFGVESGLNVEQVSSDVISVSAGLAVDGLGRVIQLSATQSISMTDLINSSRVAPMPMSETAFTSPEFLRCIRLWTKQPPSVRASVVTWIVTASWTEGAAAAKAGSVTREGIALRAVPLVLRTPFARSRTVALDARTHLRSLTAAAAFADEWNAGGSLISRAGLSRGAWCLGAQLDDRRDVPLAVVAVAGSEILFVDESIVRRERHEVPPARYWAGLMRMRPWSAYLAQVLQFQCQLSDAGVAGGTLPRSACDDARQAIGDAASYLSNVYALWQPSRVVVAEAYTPQERDEAAILAQSGGATRLESVTRDIVSLANRLQRLPTDRQLIRHGIVELPPAGFLPVAIDARRTVNDQVLALMGEGVDLRFCIVHPDLIPEELEEGQHMERISLLSGIDDPRAKPRVDVFVPDGAALPPPAPTDRFEASARIATTTLGSGVFSGAARREALDGGGTALYVAMSNAVARFVQLLTRVDTKVAADNAVAAEAATSQPNDNALWLTVRTDRAIHDLQLTESAHITGRAVLATDEDPPSGRELAFDGILTMRSVSDVPISITPIRTATATIVGTFAVIQRSSTNSSDIATVLSQRVSLTADLRWTGSDTRGALTAAIAISQAFSFRSIATQPLLRIEKEWGAKPGLTTVAVIAPNGFDVLLGGDSSAATSGTAEQFALLELMQNPDVARDTQPMHVLANAALRDVGALLGTEPTFTRDALSVLFPPVEHARLIVQATRDYVLFRRRRERQVLPWRDPIVGALHRFRLLNITAANDDEAAKLIATLRVPNANLDGAMRAAAANARAAPPVFVEFLGESATPRNDPSELRATFATMNPGSTIAGGVIASNAADGPAILARRLDTTAPLLAPATMRASNATMLALPETPPDLVTLDADGVVLFVTV